MRRIALDLRSGSAAIRVATLAAPLATASTVRVGGAVILARQLTRPPYTVPFALPATSWHDAIMHPAARGCRPPPKAYTELTVRVEGLVAGVSGGLEPGIAAISRAAKRLVPPTGVQGDASVAPVDAAAAGLQWWDKMRYQWRGVTKVVFDGAALVVAATHEAAAASHHTRLEATCRLGELSFLPDARLQVRLPRLFVCRQSQQPTQWPICYTVDPRSRHSASPGRQWLAQLVRRAH